MISKIIATGSCVPDICLTNEALSQWMETSDEWIRSRTGIGARRLAAMPEPDANGCIRTHYGDSPLFTLAREAAKRALSMAEAQKGLAPEDVDLILVATSSHDELFPALACRLQEALGLSRAAGYDIVLACTGFLAALQMADAYIRAGVYRTVLVIGAEVLSRFVDWEDRDTAILFGDGAGAVVMSADPGHTEDGAGILGTVLHADGAGADALTGRAMYWNERMPAAIRMDGRAVFSFAVRRVPEVIRELLAGEGLRPDLYLLHQANYRIIETIAKKLQEPMEKFPHNLERFGNTSAASIPLLMDELNRSGSLKKGQLLCLAGFGAGLSYGAALLRW
ncbi:MAG: beta-ketoacyl-ACP synthase III [Eubacteriales bacterium]|nr:beta-ketoacyl-ACP synthase III [Eubacteriales bacterium]